MFISVIIPTRNRYDYVSLLIDDLLKQDVSNFEIIVVDQSEVSQPISQCEHILTKTLGPCVSRNIGSKKGKGDILVFLDDDARVNPNFIREITNPIINDRFDVVAGAICDLEGNYLNDSKNFLKLRTSNFIKVITSNPDGEVSRITLAYPAGCSAILKSVFNAVDGFNENFDPGGAGEDREMAIKLYQSGFAIWYNAQAKLLHSVAPVGGSRDIGSRTLMIDVHTYAICKRYFSEALALSLKRTILRDYRLKFYNSIISFKMIRTKYRALKEVKRLLN